MLDRLVFWSKNEDMPDGYAPQELPARNVEKLGKDAVAALWQRRKQSVEKIVDKALGDDKDDAERRTAMRRLVRARIRKRRGTKTRDLAEYIRMNTEQLALEAKAEEREAPLTLEQTRRYMEMATKETAKGTPEYDERYPELFDGPHEHRIYLPLLPGLMQDGDYMSDTHARVAQALTKHEFTDLDYRKGYCKDTRGNTVKLIKALNQIEYEGLAKKVEADPSRKLDPDKLAIVISRHPYDIARMSTGRGWVSCMAVGGSHHHHVRSDLRNGTLVAYLISKNDPNIDDPLSRILLKPLKSEKTDDTILSVCKAYGLSAPEFSDTLNRFVADHVNAKADPGYYAQPNGVYDDGDATHRHQLPEAAMTDAREFLRLRKIRHIKVGKRIYAWGNIHLAQHGLEKLPDLSNVVLYGSFNAAFNRLTDLKGFPRKVTGNVHMPGNRLRHLHELKGRRMAGLTVDGNMLQTLEGGPSSINGNFSCGGNPLQSLKGLPKFTRHCYTPWGSYFSQGEVPKNLLEAERLDPRLPSGPAAP